MLHTFKQQHQQQQHRHQQQQQTIATFCALSRAPPLTSILTDYGRNGINKN